MNERKGVKGGGERTCERDNESRKRETTSREREGERNSEREPLRERENESMRQ